MPDTTVKVFQSTDSGAPVLSGAAGSLVALLDACLVNGYGSVTLTSLVVGSNVATATVPGGHGFTALGTTGPVIRIAAVTTPAALNGDWRVSIISPTQFAFTTSGISDQTATGTITAKRAPAGFSKAFTGTNKAVYRSDDVAGRRFYLRILDTSATDSRIIGYETMTTVDAGTNPFPTAAQMSGGLHFIKSDLGSTPPWRLFADGRIFYLFGTIANNDWNNYGSGYKTATLAFGDFNSFKVNDTYNGIVAGAITADVNTAYEGLLGFNQAWNASRITARNYNGATKSVPNASYLPLTNWPGYRIGAHAQNPYPNEASSGLIVVPYSIFDQSGANAYFRGTFPGLYSPLHDFISDGTVETTADGKQLFICRLTYENNSYAQAAIDLTGPWR